MWETISVDSHKGEWFVKIKVYKDLISNKSTTKKYFIMSERSLRSTPTYT